MRLWFISKAKSKVKRAAAALLAVKKYKQTRRRRFSNKRPSRPNPQGQWPANQDPSIPGAILRHAPHIKDAAMARVIVRCWAYSNDGRIEAAEKDQRKRWRASSIQWHDGAWRFDDVPPRIHDASDFDLDDDEAAADRAAGSTAPITKRDQYDADWDDDAAPGVQPG